jgi:hypothetical protein
LAEGRPRAMVLSTTAGAINRGACIAELSQYPGEVEYLWAPCSFLEPMGARSVELVTKGAAGTAGVVTIVPVLPQSEPTPRQLLHQLLVTLCLDNRCRSVSYHISFCGFQADPAHA